MKRFHSINLLRGFVIILGFIVFVSLLQPAAAVAAKPFYKGKTVEIIVPMSAGGGTDIGARFLAPWLTKFVPGNPRFVVINKPGAGGSIGTNYAYNVARPDGLTMLSTSGGVNVLSLLQRVGVEFDITKMPMFIASNSSYLHVALTSLYKDFKELFEDPPKAIYGHLPVGGGTTTSFLLGAKMLGFKLNKLVAAYKGSGDARRAFRAHEINCSSETVLGYPGHVAPKEKEGEVQCMWQTGTLDANINVIRYDPPLGHVPTLDDRYREIHGKEPSGIMWEAHKVIIGNVALVDKIWCFPPGTPDRIVKIMSDACEKMVKDPKFIHARKTKAKVDYLAGRQLQKTFKKAVIDANPKAVSWLRNWVKTDYNVQIKPEFLK